MIKYESAKTVDAGDIESVLTKCGLPTDGITPHLKHFFVAKSDDSIIGSVGIEVYSGIGLLRSLAVLPSVRGKGIGKELFLRAVAHAHAENVNELYLLTTTADGFFSKRGFKTIERVDAPTPLQSSSEFKTICPKSAICMQMRIEERAIYFPRETLPLKPDVPGAKMWGVALQKTLLTYFELEPNCRFDHHKHESEQITMVLEGELFFEVDKDTFCLKPGEVIAIPSNVAHAVFTRDKPVKAIDAWSPVMPQYIRPNALEPTLPMHTSRGQRGSA
jgi:amino-acid N-acetyltransferase